MNKLPKILVLLILFLSNSSPLNASGNEETVSLEQASEMVRLKSKGRILSAKTNMTNGKQTHRIQVLTPSGRVKIFQISSSNKRIHNGTFTSLTRSKESSKSNRRGRRLPTNRHLTPSERNKASISSTININNSNQEGADQR